MKKVFSASLCILLFSAITYAQEVPKNLSDDMFPAYYRQRISAFRTMPVRSGQIVFLGNSIIDAAQWDELFDNDPNVINRGINGDITAGILNRLDEITRRRPSKVFLLIGNNDLLHGIHPDSVEKNIFLIVRIIHRQSPGTKLYIQSITPVSSYHKMFAGHTGNGSMINEINSELKNNASKYDYTYVDIHTLFAGAEGKSDIRLTEDGLFLQGNAYQVWKHKIYSYVYDLQTKPSLIPLPRKISWRNDFFPVYKCSSIIIDNDSLENIAYGLQKIIADNGFDIPVSDRHGNNFYIQLKIGNIHGQIPLSEAYHLTVDSNKIILIAHTLHGLFNGMQTLRQLMRAKSVVDGCEIEDQPSFEWRGYMVDVGRNYQSMDLLKRQIDIMASLKLNIFHFHLTEDAAWRLYIKQYPQLTDARNMTRNAGMFYTVNDLKELIAYCKERFISLVPEIDMPGHSMAFKRAMGFDMQSDSGTLVMKNIVTEICDTYDVPYVHIGGDEVKIQNRNFLPQMISFIESKGKKVIGWEPGGNFTPSVIRQLWGDAAGKTGLVKGALQIDSRNLYVNHMDAEESVVSIFNHEIDNVLQGNDQKIGATLCLWNDRRLNAGGDNLTQNPVFPAMVAFAERSWCGGGYGTDCEVFLNDTASGEFKDFSAFESRLEDIKKEFFSQLPFPYVKQQNIHWLLIGPYNNAGDLSKSFWPEKENFDFARAAGVMQVTGATIILRHFWQPLVKGVLSDPQENTTHYAYAKYWSDTDTVARMWLGFYDFSRSTPTDPPRLGGWNNLQSKIWLNGKIIAPPQWQRAGQQSNLEMPYTDENYYFRAPATVHLQKGWNTVLIKSPVGKFNSGIWYAPVKWMFTAVFVKSDGHLNWEQDVQYYDHH